MTATSRELRAVADRRRRTVVAWRLVLGVGRPYKGPMNPDDPASGVPSDPGHSLVVEEASPRLKRPPLYQVLLLNDDYTPMEFVVDVLERIFGMDRVKATRVMLEVHPRARASAGSLRMRSPRPRSPR